MEKSITRLILLIIFSMNDIRGFATLHPEEVKTLEEIAVKIGVTNWNLKKDPCSEQENQEIVEYLYKMYISSDISCACDIRTCHVVKITLAGQNLSGVLPREFSKLKKLKYLDLRRNCFTGSIPSQWASLNLVSLNLIGNKLSGSFPLVLTNISTLETLAIEANDFSGPIPSDITKLINLESLVISSNAFTGGFPLEIFRLVKLKNLRMSDTGFTGKIPNMFHDLKDIEIFHLQGTFLEGPIPASLTSLLNLTDLRISDLKGSTSSEFPDLKNMKSITNLVLRSCMLTGSIPKFLGNMKKLDVLDLSFNQLVGEIPLSFSQAVKMNYIYLKGNQLSGRIPQWIKSDLIVNVDISENNFTWNKLDKAHCSEGNANLVETYSSSASNLTNVESCMKQGFPCAKEQYYNSLYINCGGEMLELVSNDEKFIYESDLEKRGVSTYYNRPNWAFSSTGNFISFTMEDQSYIKANSSPLITTNASLSMESLYTTARISPVSLTYYGLCLENGRYRVDLHFAEIMFTNLNNTFTSTGKRVFDIFIQNKLVHKDFDIAVESGQALTPMKKTFSAIVKEHTLKIHLYWAGRGTQGIPFRGIHGPLISAIAVSQEPEPENKLVIILVSIAAVLIVALIFGVVYFVAKRLRRKGNNNNAEVTLMKIYSHETLKTATNNFSQANRIGSGGSGRVYRGTLDGEQIAVKILSSNKAAEFLKEMGLIVALRHPNLVTLHGCCVKGKKLMLVLEYMENNSLTQLLFHNRDSEVSWARRKSIVLGVARGLKYLHERSIKVIHRDIKTCNILLDAEMTPKISDFGLAEIKERDGEGGHTHLSGTMGYIDPEIARTGQLTEKADVFSFGVVLVEVLSRQRIVDFNRPDGDTNLLNIVGKLKREGRLNDVIDPEIGRNNLEEAAQLLNLALQCTRYEGSRRPTMAEVVRRLEDRDLPAQQRHPRSQPFNEIEEIDEDDDDDDYYYYYDD